jgi:hypothetical protein
MPRECCVEEWHSISPEVNYVRVVFVRPGLADWERSTQNIWCRLQNEHETYSAVESRSRRVP